MACTIPNKPPKFPMMTTVIIIIHHPTMPHPQRKVERHRNHQPDAQQRGPPPFVVHALDVAPLADLVDAPDVQDQAVQQRQDGEDGEGPRGGQGDGVAAEVEQGRGDGAQDDGELEPREEGPLGGEVDLGFDADGDVDSCWRLEDRSLKGRDVR